MIHFLTEKDGLLVCCTIVKNLLCVVNHHHIIMDKVHTLCGCLIRCKMVGASTGPHPSNTMCSKVRPCRVQACWHVKTSSLHALHNTKSCSFHRSWMLHMIMILLWFLWPLHINWFHVWTHRNEPLSLSPPSLSLSHRIITSGSMFYKVDKSERSINKKVTFHETSHIKKTTTWEGKSKQNIPSD